MRDVNWAALSWARGKVAGEEGTIHKDWGGRIPIALCYPNTYYLGMSNLGFQTVYALFNSYEDLVCERAFADRFVVALESGRRLDEFPVVAFSLSYELDYFNLVALLRRAGIPPLAEDREEAHPLILAGGPCVMENPEPLAPLCDVLAIGEGEVLIPGLVEKLRLLAERGKKEQLLGELADLPGVYVPRFYQVQYGAEGAVAKFGPALGWEHLPFPIEREWLGELDLCPTASVVLSRDTEFGDMYLLEVSRGCGRGCRFCLTRSIYHPTRIRSPERILEMARQGLRFRDRLGLVGAAVSDYPDIGSLAKRLVEMGAKLSISSLRADSLSPELAEALAAGGAEVLTIAPEAGSQRMRNLIGKGLSEEDLVRAAELARRFGFRQIKLYFMIGLPQESDQEIEAIPHLVRKCQRAFLGHVVVEIAPFVPKPHTPFEDLPMALEKALQAKMAYLKRALRARRVEVRGESVAWAEVQGTLSRGDRQLGYALAKMEARTLRTWDQALRAAGLKVDFYLRRERSSEEIRPWRVIAGPPL